MRILLTAINAKYIHSNLAVYSLQAYARKYQEHIGLAEFTINQNKEEILKGIFRRKPEVLCISCYIWNISLVKELVREIHKILPDTAIWLGGPEVSYDAEKVLKDHPEITGIMKGEGEATFLELAACYVESKTSEERIDRLEQIAGITYRRRFADEENNKAQDECAAIRDNGWHNVMDLSEIPFVYENLENFENRIIYYESSRGCPFSCSYCLSSIDKKLRFRDLNLVKKELQFFLDHKVPQVKFVDRTFNCSHEHAMEIWRYLIAHDNGITNFHFEVAADLLTEEEISLIQIMRPGMIQLEIGVQSTNPATIREIHRKMDLDRVKANVERIRQGNNVHQHLDLIAGLPWEDYETFGRSFDEVYEMKPQQLQLGFLKVLKGSYMSEMAEEYGCCHQDKEPYEVLFTRWLPYEDLLRLKLVEEMTEVYYNSGQFLKTIPAAVSLFESPFAFYQALGDYYEQMGYLDISHTRIRRYEILRDFLKETAPGKEQMFRELLVFDLYSRENLKTRPTWADDQKPYKSRFRRFYQQEVQERRLLPGYEEYDEKQMSKMTHLEVMHFHPDTLEPGIFVYLFDYQKRDVLTYAASCFQIELEEEESYVVVDLETTGLQPGRDRILEIGAVKVEDGKVTDTFCMFINPRMEIPEYIQQLTGITQDMVRDGVMAEEAFCQFHEFCGDMTLMGHNLMFDYSFLKHQAVNQKIPFEKKGIDTLKIARTLLPDLESRSLTSLCEYFQINREQAHRAFHDALATHELYVKLKRIAPAGQKKVFQPVQLQYRPKRQSPITDSQKAYLNDLVKYHKIELDADIDSMTKSEASRKIDNIISQYGRIVR